MLKFFLKKKSRFKYFVNYTKKSNCSQAKLFLIAEWFWGPLKFVVTILRHIEGKWWILTKRSCISGKI